MSPPEPQKVAIITGASQGIGAGLVEAFRAAGYAVVGTALSMPPQRRATTRPSRATSSEPATAERVVGEALDRFGRIDTLINNAGIYIGKPFTDYSVEDYNAITAVNLGGFFHITQRAIRQMVDQGAGHVVNISTSLVDHADSGRPCALTALTKGGLAAVARSLAVEYASRGVRVNAVSLGVIRTPVHNEDSYAGMAGAASTRAAWGGERCRRRDPLPRARHVRHRGDLAHRWRPIRGSLMLRARPASTGPGRTMTLSHSCYGW